MRSFEERFDAVEKRLRVSQIGVHLIVAVAVAGAAVVATSANTKRLKSQLQRAEQQKGESHRKLETGRKEFEGTMRRVESERERRRTAVARATELVEAQSGGNADLTARLLENLETDDLNPLERRLLDDRMAGVRAELSSAAYRQARKVLAAGNKREALPLLRRAVVIGVSGKDVSAARYVLAVTLRELSRFDEALAVFREITKRRKDTAVASEAQYWVGVCLAGMKKTTEARAIFREIVTGGGRHAASAKNQLAALSGSTSGE